MEQSSGGGFAKKKPRLLALIGGFLISHSGIVSVVCCFLGFIALLLLPMLAKNTYISENALMPGSANPMLSGHDMMEGNKLVKELIHWKPMPDEAGRGVPRLIAQHMVGTGADVYFHKFHSQTNQFHPLYFFSGTPYSGSMRDNNNCTSPGVNTIGIIRAPRGDGKEAIVLVTPYNSEDIKLSDALSLGLAYSIFSLLSRVTWLAKDIIWLAADSQYGEYASVAAWLADYHNPIFFSNPEESETDTFSDWNILLERLDNLAKQGISDDFKRSGTIAAALVIKVVERRHGIEKDSLNMYAEASNGQMPNLDLINIVNYLADRQGLRVKVGAIYCLLSSMLLKIVGEIQYHLSKVAGSLNPQWRFGVPVSDYIEGAATLASSMYHQALGVPTGSHGAFRDYQVDAITLEISPKISLNNEIGHSAFLMRAGRVIEGVIRSVNNLLEKFHQSFFLYFLTSSGKFVSIGVYMVPFALLAFPLLILAAALYTGKISGDFSNNSMIDKTSHKAEEKSDFIVGSWQWLHAAKLVFIVYLWAAIVSMLPILVYQIPNRTSSTSFVAWFVLLVILSFCWILGSPYPYSCSVSMKNSKANDWATLKAVTIGAASIGLGLMSVINFATAQIGAILLVPMCLVVHPLKLLIKTKNLRTILLIICNLSLGIFGCPPIAFFVLKGLSEGFSKTSLGDFWNWVEVLWSWNSATYLYLLLVHLPSWVLCLHVLLHP